MIIGRLKHRVAFFEKVIEKDKTGELHPSFCSLFSCWGEIRNPSIKEFAQHEKKIETITILIRYALGSQVKLSHYFQVENKDTIYEIFDLQPDDQNQTFLLMKGREYKW